VRAEHILGTFGKRSGDVSLGDTVRQNERRSKGEHRQEMSALLNRQG
jgi:hypothetical protein